MENTKICVTTKEGNVISVDNLLEAYELVEEFYKKFPFATLSDKVDYYYKVQKVINKTNNKLIKEKKEFITKLLDNLNEIEDSEIIDELVFL